jgi:hypothetical protein
MEQGDGVARTLARLVGDGEKGDDATVFRNKNRRLALPGQRVGCRLLCVTENASFFEQRCVADPY